MSDQPIDPVKVRIAEIKQKIQQCTNSLLDAEPGSEDERRLIDKITALAYGLEVYLTDQDLTKLMRGSSADKIIPDKQRTYPSPNTYTPNTYQPYTFWYSEYNYGNGATDPDISWSKTHDLWKTTQSEES